MSPSGSPTAPTGRHLPSAEPVRARHRLRRRGPSGRWVGVLAVTLAALSAATAALLLGGAGDPPAPTAPVSTAPVSTAPLPTAALPEARPTDPSAARPVIRPVDPAASAGVAAEPAADPVEIRIPRIGVTSALVRLGTDGAGVLQPPAGAESPDGSPAGSGRASGARP